MKILKNENIKIKRDYSLIYFLLIFFTPIILFILGIKYYDFFQRLVQPYNNFLTSIGYYKYIYVQNCSYYKGCFLNIIGYLPIILVIVTLVGIVLFLMKKFVESRDIHDMKNNTKIPENNQEVHKENKKKTEKLLFISFLTPFYLLIFVLFILPLLVFVLSKIF